MSPELIKLAVEALALARTGVSAGIAIAEVKATFNMVGQMSDEELQDFLNMNQSIIDKNAST